MPLNPLSWKVTVAIILTEILFVTLLIVWYFSGVRIDL